MHPEDPRSHRLPFTPKKCLIVSTHTLIVFQMSHFDQCIILKLDLPPCDLIHSIYCIDRYGHKSKVVYASTD